ncbi:glycerophosphodiester phosphodiesterase family protein [Halalkalibacter urbisdiaboli]|uniref:glycerophosphodiester phosphodiesterase family protein n=1 Tax=Halalkalibacter urbisdiaboli TaxID=1960589 RepID=UPI0013FD422D|nr:glycerophosphodiester phosphodiesterase family protein [Halalkalibacter urbisdiaboli]
MTRTNIFAHRGLSSLYPENTMAAFRAAAELGIEGIELDVQLSKDEVPVVIHDSELERTTNGTGLVKSDTIDQLKLLSAGEWFSEEFKHEKIATLEEVLAWAQSKKIIINIEIKTDVLKRELLVQKVLPLISKYELLHRVIVSSFDHNLIRLIKRREPKLETAVIVVASLISPDLYLADAAVEGYHCHSASMSEKEMIDLMSKGVRVRPYTVNDKNEMVSIMKIGCDAFFTDYPQIAVEVREELIDQ